MEMDTIAAIATGLSNAGISIIRISGKDAIGIVDLLFRAKKENFRLEYAKSHTLHYGILEDNKVLLDEVLVSVMRSPNTYTREDVVEINCHGGIVVTKRILDAVVRCGARLAEPGEFTKRAFLNGRIDLSQAEAVIDIIQAKSNMELENSVRQLRGNIFKEIKDLRQQILLDIAFIEAALDDPEHISLDGFAEKLEGNIVCWQQRLQKMLRTSENGRRIKEGIKTVILGKPNTGKSSLLNLLLGENRAIVTDIAGTTRDALEEDIRLGDINLHIVDTAGIRSTEDVIEKIGVEKAKKIAKEAELIIYVVDSSVPLDENDSEIIAMIKNKKCIILFNKSDLDSEISYDELKIRLQPELKEELFIIKTSLKENTGIDEFENAVKELFIKGKISSDNEIIITNMRHKEALKNALESLLMVKKSLQANMPEDFFSIDLMEAYKWLGKIIGEEIEEDLINEIFSSFCMGK